MIMYRGWVGMDMGENGLYPSVHQIRQEHYVSRSQSLVELVLP